MDCSKFFQDGLSICKLCKLCKTLQHPSAAQLTSCKPAIFFISHQKQKYSFEFAFSLSIWNQEWRVCCCQMFSKCRLGLLGGHWAGLGLLVKQRRRQCYSPTNTLDYYAIKPTTTLDYYIMQQLLKQTIMLCVKGYNRQLCYAGDVMQCTYHNCPSLLAVACCISNLLALVPPPFSSFPPCSYTLKRTP